MFRNVLIYGKIIIPLVFIYSLLFSQPNANISIQNNNTFGSFFTVNTIIEFKNSDLSSTDYYKIIGIPGDTTIALSTAMTGQPINDWVAFYDDGGDHYLPYTEANKDNFNFSPGKAFWIISKYDLKLGPYSVSTVKLNKDNCYEIPLHANWNLISNPFDKAINWQDVRTKNNIQNDLIYYFHSGLYEFSSIKMEPFLGYYYYNRNNLDKLILPYSTSSSLNKSNNANEFESITINIENENRKTEAVVLFNDIFSEALDDFDQILPPMQLTTFSISLLNYLMPAGRQALAIESLKNIQDGISIPFRIKNHKLGNIALTINHSPGLGNNYFALYNILNGSKTIITNNQQINLAFQKAEEDYLLLVGTSAYIETFVNEPIPTNIELYQNYPNPFNPQTTIQFNLPKSEFVNIIVINSIGQKVDELVNGLLSKGKHSVTFKSNNLSSGIYFYQLKTQSSTISKKMVLLQ
ncbi:MAG: T9SS type A sorting domain-containing protein [bacterium]